VIAATGTAAASSNDMPRGFGAMALSARTVTNSAKAPVRAPKTSSPDRKLVTAFPTASTSPAKSVPTLFSFGLTRPICGRPKYGVPLTPYQSAGFTDAARTRTSTSSSAGTGVGSSRSARAASGVPYASRTTAFTTGRPAVWS
jgi:hypothetical protein